MEINSLLNSSYGDQEKCCVATSKPTVKCVRDSLVHKQLKLQEELNAVSSALVLLDAHPAVAEVLEAIAKVNRL